MTELEKTRLAIRNAINIGNQNAQYNQNTANAYNDYLTAMSIKNHEATFDGIERKQQKRAKKCTTKKS